jgi:hypothetical protein
VGPDAAQQFLAPAAAAEGVSSPDAVQLFGLLCSMLKVYTSKVSQLVAQAATGMIFVSFTGEDQRVGSAALAAVAFMLTAAFGSESTASESSSTAGSSARDTAAAVLLWLVLLGRCCYACAVLVQHWQAGAGSDSDSESEGLPNSCQSILWLLDRPGFARMLQQLQLSLAGVVQWLGVSSTVQQLTVLGYQPYELQQQLAGLCRELADAVPALVRDLQFAEHVVDGSSAAPAEPTAPGVLKAAQEQLQAASKVLACFAIPHACNNPACSSMWSPSEAQLVGGCSCICAGCHTARYCGRACLRAAWRQHKPVCKALAAAAAAPAAGRGS